MPQSNVERFAYVCILLAYLVIGALFALRTPDWQAPDEPAHYNYVAQVAGGRLLPVIKTGDWDNQYLEDLKASGFAVGLLSNLDTVRYENHQPPLYYWLAAPLYLLTNGSLFVLRLYSVLLGTVTVALSYAISREMVPARPQIALAVMALVAFLPQHLHMMASVNNDALAGVIIALILLATLRYLKDAGSSATQLGVLVGLAFIIKTTAYFMAGVVLLAIILHWHKRQAKCNQLFRSLWQVSWPAALFALLWWGRNLMVYGFPDFLGLARHDAIVVGQKRTADFIAEIGVGPYLQHGLTTTFKSFWGQFGWMAAPMDGALPHIYTVLLLLALVAISGLLIHLFWLHHMTHLTTNTIRKPNLPDVQGTLWLIIGLMMFFALAQFVFYNTTFVQLQGRYLFTALIPLAIGMASGVDTWQRLLLPWFAWAQWLTVALFLWFAPLDLYLIWRVIPGALG